MKQKTILTILAAFTTAYGHLLAAPSTPQPPPHPKTDPTAPTTLDGNYSITILDGLDDAKSDDIILSGNGPRFQTSFSDPTRNFDIFVTQKDAFYILNYTISIVHIISCNGMKSGVVTNLSGSYCATLGQPFSVLQVGDKTLSIQIDKTKPKK